MKNLNKIRRARIKKLANTNLKNEVVFFIHNNNTRKNSCCKMAK